VRSARNLAPSVSPEPFCSRCSCGTQVNSSDYFGHSKFGDALSELQDIAATGGAAGGRTVGRAGVFVLNSAGKILSAPAIIGDALLQ
jgi:hypothetical protein